MSPSRARWPQAVLCSPVCAMCCWWGWCRNPLLGPQHPLLLHIVHVLEHMGVSMDLPLTRPPGPLLRDAGPWACEQCFPLTPERSDPQPWPYARCPLALLCSLGKGRAMNWQQAPCPSSPLHLPKALEPSSCSPVTAIPPVPSRPLPVREGLPLLWVTRDRWGRRQQVGHQ